MQWRCENPNRCECSAHVQGIGIALKLLTPCIHGACLHMLLVCCLAEQAGKVGGSEVGRGCFTCVCRCSCLQRRLQGCPVSIRQAGLSCQHSSTHSPVRRTEASMSREGLRVHTLEAAARHAQPEPALARLTPCPRASSS
jgi:hypothetical protein